MIVCVNEVRIYLFNLALSILLQLICSFDTILY